MKKNISSHGRNCSYFPIARGRFESILKIRSEDDAISYTISHGYYTGQYLWRLFFFNVFIAMIMFAVATVYVNNTDFEIIDLVEDPLLPLYFGIAAAYLILPFVFFLIKGRRKPVPVILISRENGTITAGKMRGKNLTTIEHNYKISELETIEVLRNYETRGRPVSGGKVTTDSYELNLYFPSGDVWLGITESRNRQHILDQAHQISKLTGVPAKENNVTDGFTFDPSNSSGTTPSKQEQSSGFESDLIESVNPGVPVNSNGLSTQSFKKNVMSHNNPVDMADLPPFIRDLIGEPVSSLTINAAKLKQKRFPLKMSTTKKISHQFTPLISPVVSHMVNKVEYYKSLAALEYLCSDRYDSRMAREEKIHRLEQAGWQGEKELFLAITMIFDSQSGSVIEAGDARDMFERYYMGLSDDIYIPRIKYRLILMEYIEKIITESSDRYTLYEQNPDGFQAIQRSESYALKFIIDVAAVVICGMGCFISLFFIRTGIAWREPTVIAGGAVSTGITILLIYFWLKIRKKLGKSIDR